MQFALCKSPPSVDRKCADTHRHHTHCASRASQPNAHKYILFLSAVQISSAHVIGCLRDICAAWHQTVAVVLTCVVMLNTASVPEQRCVGVRLRPGASSTPVISGKLHARATHARNVTTTTCGRSLHLKRHHHSVSQSVPQSALPQR